MMSRLSSLVLLCVILPVLFPGVSSVHSFNLFPGSYGFPHLYHSPPHVSDLFSRDIFDSFFNPLHHSQQPNNIRLLTASECRDTCSELEENSLNNANYRTQTDSNGILNLLIQFKDNGQPISLSNVALNIREDRSVNSVFGQHNIFSPFHRFAPVAPSKYILDVSMLRNSGGSGDRKAAWCGCAPRKVEEYRKSFNLPLGTDVRKVTGELLSVDDKTIALKVQLPKEKQNNVKQQQMPELSNQKVHPAQQRARDSNAAVQAEIAERQKQWEQAEQNRLAEISRAKAAQAQAEAQARADAEAAAVQKAKAEQEARIRFIDEQIELKRQRQQQQQQQQLSLERQRQAQAQAEALRQKEQTAQLERQLQQERVRQEQQYQQRQQQQQQQQKQQQQLQQEKLQREAKARAAAEAEEEDRLLAERKAKAYRERYGGEGEVILDLLASQDRQSKKYAQMSEERRQWKDSEIIYLD